MANFEYHKKNDGNFIYAGTHLEAMNNLHDKYLKVSIALKLYFFVCWAL